MSSLGLKNYERFWQRHPALWYGVFFYIGVVFALQFHAALFVPLLFLLSFQTQEHARRIVLGILFAFGAYFYASNDVILPPDDAEEITGSAIVEVCDVSSDSRYGRTFYKLKLNIAQLLPDDGGFVVKNVASSFVYHEKSGRPKGGCRYKVAGTLAKTENGYRFKANEAWEVLESTISFVEWRYRAKAVVKCFLASKIAPGDARTFLEGVVVGEFHDIQLASQLKRFGLQHIIVVSGFHFSLITAIMAAFLRLLFPWKVTVTFLVIIIWAYLLFIGPTASVLRAFVAVQLALAAKIIEKRSSGINALGVGLLVVLFLDPAICLSASFQLSFLATWAILLLYPVAQKSLRVFFPTYSAETVLQFSFVEQLLFLLSTFFLTSLALVFAVTLVMLPVSLFVFHSFPLLGILYNCFFPFCVSIAIFLLCMGTIFSVIEPISYTLFFLCENITDISLTLVNHMPAWVDSTLYAQGLSATFLIAYLCLVSYFGITRQSTSEMSM